MSDLLNFVSFGLPTSRIRFNRIVSKIKWFENEKVVLSVLSLIDAEQNNQIKKSIKLSQKKPSKNYQLEK